MGRNEHTCARNPIVCLNLNYARPSAYHLIGQIAFWNVPVSGAVGAAALVLQTARMNQLLTMYAL